MKCKVVPVCSLLRPAIYRRDIVIPLEGPSIEHNQTDVRRYRIGSIVISCILQATVASAAPPADMTPDPALHAWFESLEQPGTRLSCCSISDCHFTSYEERDGHYEITVDGWPRVVPDDAVLRTTSNPASRAVVCYNYVAFGPHAPDGEVRTAPQDTVAILCFLPSRPSS